MAKRKHEENSNGGLQVIISNEFTHEFNVRHRSAAQRTKHNVDVALKRNEPKDRPEPLSLNPKREVALQARENESFPSK